MIQTGILMSDIVYTQSFLNILSNLSIQHLLTIKFFTYLLLNLVFSQIKFMTKLVKQHSSTTMANLLSCVLNTIILKIPSVASGPCVVCSYLTNSSNIKKKKKFHSNIFQLQKSYRSGMITSNGSKVTSLFLLFQKNLQE